LQLPTVLLLSCPPAFVVFPCGTLISDGTLLAKSYWWCLGRRVQGP
jgi:hypothetical protein